MECKAIVHSKDLKAKFKRNIKDSLQLSISTFIDGIVKL